MNTAEQRLAAAESYTQTALEEWDNGHYFKAMGLLMMTGDALGTYDQTEDENPYTHGWTPMAGP
jgi:hypothetical protein